MPNAGLDGLLPLFLGTFCGTWFGSVLVCWSALSWLREGAIRSTLLFLSVLVPLALIGSSVGYNSFSRLAPAFPWLAVLVQ
jgi:hypothetical protein